MTNKKAYRANRLPAEMEAIFAKINNIHAMRELYGLTKEQVAALDNCATVIAEQFLDD